MGQPCLQEWQNQTGAVVVGTTPSVQYVYDDGATGGVASHLRMTDIIYPNGRDISYSYGTAGGADDILSPRTSSAAAATPTRNTPTWARARS